MNREVSSKLYDKVAKQFSVVVLAVTTNLYLELEITWYWWSQVHNQSVATWEFDKLYVFHSCFVINMRQAPLLSLKAIDQVTITQSSQ